MRTFHNQILFTIASLYLSVYIFQFSACSSSSSTASNQNVSRIYKSNKELLHPEYIVFHRTGTTSELHFKINTKELLYSKQSDNENFSARFKIHYRLISSYETKDIIDSATVILSDAFSNSPKDIVGKLDFNATFTNNYLLQVELYDLNRNISTKSFINIEKLNHNTRQNFILQTPKNKTTIFRNNLQQDEFIHIKYRNPNEELYVRYYNRKFPLPSPPFASSNTMPFEYRADSLFTIMPNEVDVVGVNLKSQGFYHIQADTNYKEGSTVFRFDNDFPHFKKPEHLLAPLNYLTSKNEFESMSSANNIKASVDSFWLAAGGSHDRARELIRKYYNRVEDANNYFSSYIEGWRTDRGLIYIIYGPPNVVYKSSDSESWVYGEENNFQSLSFVFLKVVNPFTDNDYRLERSPNFKVSWFNAVEMWRQGRIYAEK